MNRTIIFSFLCLLVSSVTFSQDYSISTSKGFGTDLSFSNNSIGRNLIQVSHSKLSNTVSFPFAVSYYGKNYNKFKVSVTGYLTFDTNKQSLTRSMAKLPSNALEGNTIFAAHNSAAKLFNHYNGVFIESGTVQTFTLGSAPNRSFYVRWDKIQAGAQRVFFSIRFKEKGGFDIIHENIHQSSGSDYVVGCQNSNKNKGSNVNGSPRYRFFNLNGRKSNYKVYSFNYKGDSSDNNNNDSSQEVESASVDGGRVSTTNGRTEVTVVTNDGERDNLVFKNTSNSDEKYIYLITDEKGKILTTESGFHDFEGSPAGICLVYGLSYKGRLSVNGKNVKDNSLATGRFELSRNFINVIRVGKGDVVDNSSEVINSLNVTSPKKNETVRGSFEVKINAPAGYQHISVKIDGNWKAAARSNSTNYVTTVSGIANGSHTLHVYGKKADGSWDRGVKYTINVQGSKFEEINGASNVSAYPNPFTNSLKVNLGNNHDVRSIAVYDLTGKQVLAQNVSKSNTDVDLDLSAKNISRGIYVLKTIGKQDSRTIKIIKE